MEDGRAVSFTNRLPARPMVRPPMKAPMTPALIHSPYWAPAQASMVTHNIQKASRAGARISSISPMAAARIHAVESHSGVLRSEVHTSELQSRGHLVCRLLIKNKKHIL